MQFKKNAARGVNRGAARYQQNYSINSRTFNNNHKDFRPYREKGYFKTFYREWLPNPISFYESKGLKLHGKGEWRSALCCFHSEKNPSLRINIHNGAFRCFPCGASGGSVLDFQMLYYGQQFLAAAETLGAME